MFIPEFTLIQKCRLFFFLTVAMTAKVQLGRGRIGGKLVDKLVDNFVDNFGDNFNDNFSDNSCTIIFDNFKQFQDKKIQK